MFINIEDLKNQERKYKEEKVTGMERSDSMKNDGLIKVDERTEGLPIK